MLPSFAYVRPTSLAEALIHLSLQGARIHAGGTDLLGCLRDAALPAPSLVVSLSRVVDLRGVRAEGDGSLAIGALTTITEVADHPIIRERFTALAEAAAVVSSPQLRNQGTIGGNLCQKPRCWYYRGEFDCLRKGGELCFAYEGENQYHCIFGGESCFMVHPSDAAPALIALDASVRIASPRGVRSLPVASLHVTPGQDPTRELALEPDEILTEVVLPKPAPSTRSSYRKVRARASWDFALAGVALALQINSGTVNRAKVVLSGVAPVPWRSQPIESALTGKTLDATTISAAADAAIKGAEPLAENSYKVSLLHGLIIDQLEALTGTQ
jgi:xanthine dehydrogenase YagS FAD-binding subunit